MSKKHPPNGKSRDSRYSLKIHRTGIHREIRNSLQIYRTNVVCHIITPYELECEPTHSTTRNYDPTFDHKCAHED